MATVKNEGGFVKLSRKLLNWEWYDDINVFRIWIHLLLTVNWKDGRYRGQEVKAGERVVSMHKLSEEIGLSVQTIMRTLNKLETSGELKTTRNTSGTLISLMKWGEYQSLDQEVGTRKEQSWNTDGTRVEHGRNTDGTPINRRKKEGKKVRREEESTLTQHFPSPRRSRKGEKSKEEMIQIATEILKARGRL